MMAATDFLPEWFSGDMLELQLEKEGLSPDHLKFDQTTTSPRCGSE